MKSASLGHRGHMKGFTLIELLVVIAIIGILSSVVLASLNTARNKGADTAVKSNLAGARAQAELFYDANNNQYTNVCTSGATAGTVKSIYAQVLAAVQAAGGTSVGTTGSGTSAGTCVASASAWAAESPLKSGGFYCVDSTGAAATSSETAIGGTDYAC